MENSRKRYNFIGSCCACSRYFFQVCFGEDFVRKEGGRREKRIVEGKNKRTEKKEEE
jgi:hypothetical protein